MSKRPYRTKTSKQLKDHEDRLKTLEEKVFNLMQDPDKHDCLENAYKIGENCYRCGVCKKLCWTTIQP